MSRETRYRLHFYPYLYLYLNPYHNPNMAPPPQMTPYTTSTLYLLYYYSNNSFLRGETPQPPSLKAPLAGPQVL